MKKKGLFRIAAAVSTLAVFLASVPIQAAAASSTYIGKVNEAIIRYQTTCLLTFEEELARSVSGKPFRTMTIQGAPANTYDTDSNGNITAVYNGAWKTVCTYDSAGTIIETDFYNPAVGTDGKVIEGSYDPSPMSYYSTPEYDSAGRLSSITGDACGILEFTYDSKGRISQVAKGWSRNRMTTVTKYTYDSQNRVSEYRLFAAGTLIRDYITGAFTDSGEIQSQTINYNEYDEDGNALAPTVHSTTFTYQADGSLVQKDIYYTDCDFTESTVYGY